MFLFYASINAKYENDLEKNVISVFFYNNYKDGLERKNLSYCKISKGRKRSFQVKCECIVHNFPTFYHTSLRIAYIGIDLSP